MFRSSIMLATMCVLAGSTQAAAQQAAGVPPAPGRLTISGNIGFQAGDHDITRSTVFPLYDEEGNIDITQTGIGGGSFFDFGANYRVRNQLGAGIAFTFNSSEGDGTVTGSIPHPLFFDTFRTLSASADGLEHKERGVHLQATWRIPFTEALDFTVSAGPSFFNISQDFIRRVTFSETPPFDAVNVDAVELLSLRKNAVGFNIGVDAAYTVYSGNLNVLGVNPAIAIGAQARYTRAETDFDINDNDSASVKAGGFQIGAGVRVRLF
jgi:opacity protein-like surface antigen